MITTINKPEFKPVSITLTFETQKELDMFASLQNTSIYYKTAIGLGIPIVPMRELREIGAEPCFTMEIHDTLKAHASSF